MLSVQPKAKAPNTRSNLVNEIIRNLPSLPSGMKELNSAIKVDGTMKQLRAVHYSENNTNYLYTTVGNNHCKFLENGTVVSYNLAGDTLPDLTTDLKINRMLAQTFDCVVNNRNDGLEFIADIVQSNILGRRLISNFESN